MHGQIGNQVKQYESDFKERDAAVVDHIKLILRQFEPLAVKPVGPITGNGIKHKPHQQNDQINGCTPGQTNFIQAAIQFLREVKIELKKVTWPSRKQTIGSTAVVIALVLIISMFLGFVDIGLSNLIRVVLQ